MIPAPIEGVTILAGRGCRIESQFTVVAVTNFWSPPNDAIVKRIGPSFTNTLKNLSAASLAIITDTGTHLPPESRAVPLFRLKEDDIICLIDPTVIFFRLLNFEEETELNNWVANSENKMCVAGRTHFVFKDLVNVIVQIVDVKLPVFNVLVQLRRTQDSWARKATYCFHYLDDADD